MQMTFDYVSRLAQKHGYTVEKVRKGYQLFSHEKMPGTIEEESTLDEIYSLLYYRLVDDGIIPNPNTKFFTAQTNKV